MLSSIRSRRIAAPTARFFFLRAKSTSVQAPEGEGPLGDDGRHEIWRDGIYDHDNEPM